MSLLTAQLPTAVMVDDNEFAIHSDFRTCLRIMEAFEDIELTLDEKMQVLLHNLYVRVPENTEAALMQGLKFLNGGEISKDSKRSRAPVRLYSFSHDSMYVFSAFRQTHGIDLTTAQLHWWEFLSLFMSLDSGTKFNQIIGIRHAVLTGKATAEQKKEYKERPEVYKLPVADGRTLEEKRIAQEFLKALGGE